MKPRYQIPLFFLAIGLIVGGSAKGSVDAMMSGTWLLGFVTPCLSWMKGEDHERR